MTDNQTATQLSDVARSLNRYLPDKLVFSQPATAEAPSNIALAKYWGKRDQHFNLPHNSSLSVSLADLGSQTSLHLSDSGDDQVWFEGEQLSLTSPFARKVIAFLDLFRREQRIALKVISSNSIPTAAGLASSASGFAALTMAIDRAFALDLPPDHLSIFARLGSGSACRSLWHGFVRWDRGSRDDGSDSFAQPLNTSWPDLRIAIVPVDTAPKSTSSRQGMNHTVATSPLYPAWPAQAETDCAHIEQAIFERDFTALGQIAEANALAMHATMSAARPAVIYLNANSWRVLETVAQARQQGRELYATMDAGANVKLLFLAADTDFVSQHFPHATQISPFAT